MEPETLPIRDLTEGMTLIDPVDGLFPTAKITAIVGNYIFTDAPVGGAIHYDDPDETFTIIRPTQTQQES